MYECPKCGMLPFACVCIPWCFEHDRMSPCPDCAQRPPKEHGMVVEGAYWLAVCAGLLAIVCFVSWGIICLVRR